MKPEYCEITEVWDEFGYFDVLYTNDIGFFWLNECFTITGDAFIPKIGQKIKVYWENGRNIIQIAE
jgi:hypothetical protein